MHECISQSSITKAISLRDENLLNADGGDVRGYDDAFCFLREDECDHAQFLLKYNREEA